MPSGASSSVTGVSQTGQVVAEPRRWEDWADGAVQAVDATPPSIVFYALHGKFGPRPGFRPLRHQSGSQHRSIDSPLGDGGRRLHGISTGLPGHCRVLSGPRHGRVGPVHWESAAHVAGLLFDWLLGEKRCAVLNCNVPDRPLEEILGLRIGGLALVGAAQTSVTEEKGEPVPVTLGGEDEGSEIESDAALLQRGFASVTALRPVVEDASIDLADALGSGDIRPALA